jgi:hypothetical protein
MVFKIDYMILVCLYINEKNNLTSTTNWVLNQAFSVEIMELNGRYNQQHVSVPELDVV